MNNQTVQKRWYVMVRTSSGDFNYLMALLRDGGTTWTKVLPRAKSYWNKSAARRDANKIKGAKVLEKEL